MKHRLAFILMTTVTALILIGSLATLAASGDARAGEHTIDLVAIDAVPSGNSATSLGGLDYCTRIEVGSTAQVDIVVDAVPEDTPMVGFSFLIMYDPQILEVTAIDNEFLLTADGSSTLFDAMGDQLPDSDGAIGVAVADLSGNNETGPGVLSRLTFRARANGVSDLTLASSLEQGTFPIIVDFFTNEPVQVDQLGTSKLAVGQDCPTAPAQLIVTPGPDLSVLSQPADGGTQPQPTQPAGPDGQDTPTDSADSTGSPTPPDGEGEPELLTPGAAATATATTGALAGGGAADDVGGSNGDGDGFPTVWVIVGIALGLAAAAGAGYVLYRRRTVT